MAAKKSRRGLAPIFMFACGFVSLLLVVSCSKQETAKKEDGQSAGESRDSLTIALVGQDSVSVFALLSKSHSVNFVSSAMGVFVKGIDSVTNGSHVFWVYSVNDTMGDISSDKFLTHDSDRVVWHFRKASSGAN